MYCKTINATTEKLVANIFSHKSQLKSQWRCLMGKYVKLTNETEEREQDQDTEIQAIGSEPLRPRGYTDPVVKPRNATV